MSYFLNGIKSNRITKKLLYDPIYFIVVKYFRDFYEQNLINWKARAKLASQSSDNSKIHRVENAGKFDKGLFIMHNGLKINPISYGKGALKVLKYNRGVHEPQEELVFQEVLKSLPESATMIELGSWWAFYSMWFYKVVKNPSCFLIEADPDRLKTGQENFNINKMNASFYTYYINNFSENSQPIPTISIDDFIKKESIDFVDILHSDIQGFEFNMLKGAKNLIESKRVGYFFISTHSQKLHDDCLAYLKSYNFEIIASASIEQSYSIDGILVAKAPYYNGIGPVLISKK